MGVEQLLEARREAILRVCAEHGARNVRVFGSAVRGEAGGDSDIDLLVELKPGRSLLDLSGVAAGLEALLDHGGRRDRGRALLAASPMHPRRCILIHQHERVDVELAGEDEPPEEP